MAKAAIETSSGLKISVEGTADEVAAIIAHVKHDEESPLPKKTMHEKKQTRSVNSSTSLVDLILDLKMAGFFDHPKKVSEVHDSLVQQTHHYPMESVSTALIRRVKNGDLGRVKEGTVWAYVKR
jgi:hypothetical protein